MNAFESLRQIGSEFYNLLGELNISTDGWVISLHAPDTASRYDLERALRHSVDRMFMSSPAMQLANLHRYQIEGITFDLGSDREELLKGAQRLTDTAEHLSYTAQRIQELAKHIRGPAR